MRPGDEGGVVVGWSEYGVVVVWSECRVVVARSECGVAVAWSEGRVEGSKIGSMLTFDMSSRTKCRLAIALSEP